MSRRYELTDQEWEQVASLLPKEKTGKPGRPSKDNRTMLNGMVWIGIGANPKEIIFTSGGTESDNWAIKGIAWHQLTKKQIVTTAFEHHAILNSCRLIQDVSGRVTYILPNNKIVESMNESR